MENRSSEGKNGLEHNSEERIPKAQVGNQSGKTCAFFFFFDV